MNREIVFIASVIAMLLLMPIALKTGATLTTSIIVTALLLLKVTVLDRWVNRGTSVALHIRETDPMLQDH